MTGPWASVNGLRSISGSLYLPWFGNWVCDTTLASDDAVTGPVALIVGSLSLAGYARRSEAYGGSRDVRIVGGAGGWATELGARSYATPTGVSSAMVLADLAAECLEALGPIVPKFLGASYLRFAGRAATTLSTIAGGWWIDPLGITQVSTPRALTPIVGQFTATNRRGDWGNVQIATEDHGAWLPGAIFASALLGPDPVTISEARHFWSASGVSRVQVTAQ